MKLPLWYISKAIVTFWRYLCGNVGNDPGAPPRIFIFLCLYFFSAVIGGLVAGPFMSEGPSTFVWPVFVKIFLLGPVGVWILVALGKLTTFTYRAAEKLADQPKPVKITDNPEQFEQRGALSEPEMQYGKVTQ